MNPAPIEKSNLTMNPPPGTEGKVQPVPARREKINGHPCVSTAWKPTESELVALGQGGTVILSCMGSTMPPVLVRTTGPVCPLCDCEIKDGEMITENSSNDYLMHTRCLELRHAGMTDAEREALSVRALAHEVREALKEGEQHIEIRPDVFASRDDLANCFSIIQDLREHCGIMERAVRVLNARLAHTLGHSDASNQIAAAALNRMAEGTPESPPLPVVKMPVWVPRDEKAPAADGWYQVKNLDGSLSARFWDSYKGGVWYNATARDGFTPNISISHWLHVPLIHADPVAPPNFSEMV